MIRNGEAAPDGRDPLDRETILEALNEARWNSVKVAENLGVSLRTVRRRMKQFGLVKNR